jgi:hypothetical protein
MSPLAPADFSTAASASFGFESDASIDAQLTPGATL